MPGATRNGVGGASASAPFMKSRKIGAATVAPCSRPPKVRGLSKPTNTPAARSGEKPMNQVSLASDEVPVLPAKGLPTARTDTPVPRWTTPSSMETI